MSGPNISAVLAWSPWTKLEGQLTNKPTYCSLMPRFSSAWIQLEIRAWLDVLMPSAALALQSIMILEVHMIQLQAPGITRPFSSLTQDYKGRTAPAKDNPRLRLSFILDLQNHAHFGTTRILVQRTRSVESTRDVPWSDLPSDKNPIQGAQIPPTSCRRWIKRTTSITSPAMIGPSIWINYPSQHQLKHTESVSRDTSENTQGENFGESYPCVTNPPSVDVMAFNPRPLAEPSEGISPTDTAVAVSDSPMNSSKPQRVKPAEGTNFDLPTTPLPRAVKPL